MTLTPTRLRRITFSATIALALGVSLAACGGTAAGDSTSATPPSQSTLESALITVADLPEGMTPDSDTSDSDNDLFAGTCADMIEKFADTIADPQVRAEANFINADGSARASGVISYYADADQLRADLDTYINTLQGCTSVAGTNDGISFDLTVTTEVIDVENADKAMRLTVAGPMTSDGIRLDFTTVMESVLKDHTMTAVSTIEVNGATLADETHDLAIKQFDNARALN